MINYTVVFVQSLGQTLKTLKTPKMVTESKKALKINTNINTENWPIS